ncbi:hypothetical protein [Geomonas edaphica]|uniref:hypothetical protein n=1 Tax=Geomonas edaphica TaxID=2570226 RepID=UPI0018E09FF2|nr:hypothetical protein [Geomonas edaphica]
MAGGEKCSHTPEERTGCAACLEEESEPFWCGSCNRGVPQKRCPYCGLKARKKKG